MTLVNSTVASKSRSETRFWRVEPFDGLELVHGRYRAHAFPPHAHDRYVIVVMVSGSEQLVHGGSRHAVPAGSLVLLNPGAWHENRGSGRFEYRTFYAPVSLLHRIATDVALRRRSADALFATPVVHGDRAIARRLIDLSVALESRVTLLAHEEALLTTFGHLLRRHGGLSLRDAPARPEPAIVARVREYLAAYPTERVSLADLGTLVNRSPCHVLRAFRYTTGATPHQFQTQLRIERAMTLLRNGSTIADTAVRLGFADQSHFTRAFTRRLGVSPGRFARASTSFKTRLPQHR